MIEVTPIPGVALGLFNITMHGLFAAVGVGVGYLIFDKTTARLPQHIKERLLVLLVLGGVLGARALYVLENAGVFAAKPLDALKVWQGGLSFMGAILLVVPLWYFYLKRKKMNFLAMADAAAAPVVAGHLIGRIGDLLTWDHPGTYSALPWAAIVNGQPQHPVIVYEMIGLALILGVLHVASRKVFFKQRLLFVYLGLYGLLRIVIDFYRVEPLFFGIRQAQIIGVLLVLFSLAMFKVLSRKRPQ
ncbi:MAG: prolipoprotein diacylglyceryl transferase [Candidatus Aenigmarchaeota archaeon]|nr:prolipoprotein diacylglyceryl transferase [Candidatus Aenigmarchaeota archaeon]